MNICVLYGQKHRGSTYHITAELLDRLREDDCSIIERQLKRSSPCIGCYACFKKGGEFCPHFDENAGIIADLDAADVIIISSPTYCLEMSGQLKVFMDHLAYRWMVHRPEEAMFSKVGVAISTTAGAGADGVCKSIARQMFYWGVPKVFKYSARVMAMGWEDVDERTRKRIGYDMQVLAERIKTEAGNARPGIKTKAVFNAMRLAQKKNDYLPLDREHWAAKGWLESDRPWNRS